MSVVNDQKTYLEKLIVLNKLERMRKKQQIKERRQLLEKLQIVFSVQLTMASMFPSFLIDYIQTDSTSNYSQIKAEIQSYNPPSYVAILFFLFLVVKKWYRQPRYYDLSQENAIHEGVLLRYGLSCHIFFMKNHCALTYQLLVGLEKNIINIEMNVLGKFVMILYFLLINRLHYEIYNFCKECLKHRKYLQEIDKYKKLNIKFILMMRKTHSQLMRNNQHFQNLCKQKQLKEQKKWQRVNERAQVIDNLLINILIKAKSNYNKISNDVYTY